MTTKNELMPCDKGGRPPYEPDPRTAKHVEAMAGYGIPVEQIAKVVGVCQNTLRKYYRDEIELGATKANAKVIESLFRKATGDGQGSVAAAIFWAKTRCGWRETMVNEHTHSLGSVAREPISSDEWVRKHGGAIPMVATQTQRDAAVAAALAADD